MEHRRLGSSGLKVSEVGLGTNNFGGRTDYEGTVGVLDKALEEGVTFIDTADSYSRGRSEEFIGRALKGRRHQVLLATKFSSPIGQGPNDRGGSRHRVMTAVEAGLQRLQTDYIDLFQMHFPDPNTPIEETLRALDDLVHAGKVRYIGCSNFAGWQLAEALWTSKSLGLNAFVTAQNQYNLMERNIERELVPCCQAYGIGIIPFFPLASGFLTGKYRPDQPPPEGARLTGSPMAGRILNEANFAFLTKLEGFAQERGHSMGELAIAWLLSKPYVSSVIAGATKPEQVSSNVVAANWKLTPEEAAQVDELAKR